MKKFGIGCLAILGGVFGLVLIISVGAMLSGGDDDAMASDQTTTSVDDSADAAVAEDATPASLELHDSMLSGGVKVAVK